MFAGKLPAGAGTFECYGGKIDLCLIGFAATSLAFAPQSQRGSAFAHPFFGRRKVFARLAGGIIGGKGKYLVFGKVQEKRFEPKLRNEMIQEK